MLKKIKSVSIFAAVSVIILLFSVLSILYYDPSNNFSQNENRVLQTLPTPTWGGILSGEFASDYEDFVSDYFWLRDDWITFKSIAEFVQLKLENNDVIYGLDGYLFPKFYSFDNNRLQANLEAIRLFADQSVSDISVMVVPSSSYLLADKLPEGVPMVDEAAFIEEGYRFLSDSATPLDVAATLWDHRNQYIYYRTDHHWTTYGAWLAYTQFAKSNQLPIFDYNNASPISVEGFLGTSYSRSKNFNVTPDTIEYFEFPATLQILDREYPTQVETFDSLYDISKFDERDMYGAFLHGNNGHSVITSTVLDSQKLDSALVICDSYGYSLIPFLTENYNSITVIDVRYFVGDYAALRQTHFDDVLILYGFKSLTEYRLEPLNLSAVF